MESLLAIVIFAVLAAAVSSVLFVGQQGAIRGGDRIRAVMLTSEALAAVRSMRDASFTSLVAGQHGVCVGSEGMWQFCGTENETSDGFRTTVTLQAETEDRIRVTAETTWPRSFRGMSGAARSGSILLAEELTDWRAVKPIGDWSSPRLAGSFALETTPLFSAIALKGSYAFVTSAYGDGGKGLHVFDLSGGGDPVPVAAGFDLGSAGVAAVIAGNTLVVATADPSAEIQIFDASSPALLSQSSKLASIDLPGSGRARSLAAYNGVLFVGATEDAIEGELYSYDISDPRAPRRIGVLNDTASYEGLSLHDGYAYVASSMDAMELRVADVFNPTALTLAPGEGYNLTDVQDGLSIATVNDDVLLGRRSGEAIEELVLMDLSKGAVPSPPPGPWYQELGGSAFGVTVEPGGRYGFIASDNLAAQMQVADLAKFRAGQFPIVGSATTTTGGGRAVAYDPLTDRVLLATDRALLFFKPGG